MLVLLLAIGLPSALLTGCRSGSPDAPSPSPAAAPQDPGDLLTGLVGAVESGSRGDFLGLVSNRDPGFSTTAGMIFDNLRSISPEHLALTAVGSRRSLSAERAALLGPDAYAAEVRVTWSVPGDRAPSDQLVWMTIVGGRPGPRWAGIADGPATPRPTPLWWLEPVRYAHQGAATVITGAGIDPSGWIRAADTAIAHDVPRLRGADWNHRLVIIVPGNEQLAEQSLGVGPGADSSLAAISWPDGTDPEHAPIRVMINKAGSAGSLSTAIVLAHEAVHVATRSPVSSSPTWLVEGFADQIAYLSYPQAAQVAAAGELSAVAKDGPPAELPKEAEFADSHDLNRTYAQAWLACHYLAATYGQARLWQFYAAVDASRDGSISGPLHAVFRISSQQLITGWQHYLRAAAQRGRV